MNCWTQNKSKNYLGEHTSVTSMSFDWMKRLLMRFLGNNSISFLLPAAIPFRAVHQSVHCVTLRFPRSWPQLLVFTYLQHQMMGSMHSLKTQWKWFFSQPSAA